MKKTPEELKTIRLMRWMRSFDRNCYGDFEADETAYDRMLLHYNNNVCPYESAAAIQEGREIDMSKWQWKEP